MSIPHVNDTDYLQRIVPKPPVSAWVRVAIGVALLLSILGQTSALGVILDIVLGGAFLVWGGRAIAQASGGSELKIFNHGLVVRDAGIDYYAPWSQLHHVRNDLTGSLQVGVQQNDGTIATWHVWSKCNAKSRSLATSTIADLSARHVIPSTFAVMTH